MVVPHMRGKAAADDTIQALAGLMDSEPMRLLGVSACNEKENWRYYIAFSRGRDRVNFEEYTVPASTWAIFSGS